VGAPLFNTGLDVLAGIAEFPAHLLHVGEASGAAWGAGDYLGAAGHLGDDTATVIGAALIFADVAPAAGRAFGKLRAAKAAEEEVLSGCKGGSASSEDGIPGDAFRGKSAPKRAANYFEREHGIPRKTFGKVLHQIKAAGGLGGAADTAIDTAGNVYNDASGELLENLFDIIPGGGK
jgi:hypothetical protein